MNEGRSFCSKKCQGLYVESKYPLGNVQCIECGKSFHTNPSYVKRGGGKFCSYHCVNVFRRKKITLYKSGDYLALSGGIGRIHRALMEQKLGRKLLRTEHVHHINGNKFDNRIENLELLKDSEHHKLHWMLRKELGL